MTDLITAEEAQKLLDEVAQNPPRICMAWCGKAKEECDCYKAALPRDALNNAAPDLARTVIALHAQLADAQAALEAKVVGLVEALKPFDAVGGALFSKNWNASDIVFDGGPLRSDCLFFEDFLNLRVALASGKPKEVKNG